MTQASGPGPAAIDLPSVASLGGEDSAPAATGRAADRGLLSDFSQLTKPRITLLVVVTAYIGYELGVRALVAAPLAAAGARPGWATLLLILSGVALSCMGACALNQVMERDTDALMNRTRNRPLPAGRVSPMAALLLGLALSLAGVGLLALVANPLTAALSAFTILTYTLVYTPLKRVSSVCTIVGAVPGAMPPVMGYAAATGTCSAVALVLFAILFLWQLPHFLAIAWLYKDDYARAGLPMLPVVDPDGSATGRQILASCLALLPLGLMPTLMGVSGLTYLAGAMIAGLVFLGFGVALVRGRTRGHARALFFASLVYLPLVYGLMLLDRA